MITCLGLIVGTVETSYAQDVINKCARWLKNYKEKFEENGYDFISKYSNLNITDHKILGSFTKINNYNTDNNLPTLPKLTEFAIDYFEENNELFILCRLYDGSTKMGTSR